MSNSKRFFVGVIFALFSIIPILPLTSAYATGAFPGFFQDNVTNLIVTISQNSSQANFYLNTNGTSFDQQAIPFKFSSNGIIISGSFLSNISDFLGAVNGQISLTQGSTITHFNSFFITPGTMLYYMVNNSLPSNLSVDKFDNDCSENNCTLLNNFILNYPSQNPSSENIIFTKTGTNYQLSNGKGYGNVSGYTDEIRDIINKSITRMNVPNIFTTMLPMINNSNYLSATTKSLVDGLLNKLDVGFFVYSIDLSSVQFKNGTYTVPVTVGNGTATVTKDVMLTLKDVPDVKINSPPLITSTPIVQINETQNYGYQVIATDSDNDSLTYSLTNGGPSWLSMNSTGFVSGIAPNISSDTVYPVALQVSDGQNTVSQAFNILVKNTDPVPNDNGTTGGNNGGGSSGGGSGGGGKGSSGGGSSGGGGGSAYVSPLLTSPSYNQNINTQPSKITAQATTPLSGNDSSVSDLTGVLVIVGLFTGLGLFLAIVTFSSRHKKVKLNSSPNNL